MSAGSLAPARGRRVSDIVTLTGRSLWQGVIGFANSDNLTYAASIAFYALLSLFPLILLVLALLGRMAADVRIRTDVLSFVLRYFPTQFDFITGQIDALGSGTVTLGVAGTVALLYGALGVFSAISTAVNYAWGVEQQPGFWRHRILGFLMLLVAGLILLAAVLLVSASQIVAASWFAHVVSSFPGLLWLRSFTVRYATTLLFIGVVGFVYYYVPNAPVRFRDVWVGAIVTGLLWKGVIALFSAYLLDMSRPAAVNGPIAIVALFLGWVYAQAVILLYGVEFTAAYARLRREMEEAAPAPGA